MQFLRTRGVCFGQLLTKGFFQHNVCRSIYGAIVEYTSTAEDVFHRVVINLLQSFQHSVEISSFRCRSREFGFYRNRSLPGWGRLFGLEFFRRVVQFIAAAESLIEQPKDPMCIWMGPFAQLCVHFGQRKRRVVPKMLGQFAGTHPSVDSVPSLRYPGIDIGFNLLCRTENFRRY